MSPPSPVTDVVESVVVEISPISTELDESTLVVLSTAASTPFLFDDASVFVELEASVLDCIFTLFTETDEE